MCKEFQTMELLLVHSNDIIKYSKEYSVFGVSFFLKLMNAAAADDDDGY